MDRRTRLFWLAGLAVALVVAGVLSFYASASPDGLNKVAEDKGFAGTEKEHPLRGSPLEDYGVKGVDDERLSGGLAGIIGVAATLALATGVFWTARRRGTSGGPAVSADAGGRAGSPAGPAGGAAPAERTGEPGNTGNAADGGGAGDVQDAGNAAATGNAGAARPAAAADPE